MANIYARRNIIEPIECFCGCGKTINRYDKKGREVKFHKDCCSIGKKLSSGVKLFLSQKAKEPNRIDQSLRRISRVNQEVKLGLRKPGHFIDGISKCRDDGYLMIKKPEHHRADNHGYVFIHVLIAEEKLGRLLNDKETVHHINRNRKDNRPENIIVLPTPNDHQKLHSREDNRRDNFGKFKSKEEINYAII